MLPIHDIHSRFPEDSQVGIGAVLEDVAVLEESIVFLVSPIAREDWNVKAILLLRQTF